MSSIVSDKFQTIGDISLLSSGSISAWGDILELNEYEDWNTTINAGSTVLTPDTVIDPIYKERLSTNQPCNNFDISNIDTQIDLLESQLGVDTWDVLSFSTKPSVRVLCFFQSNGTKCVMFSGGFGNKTDTWILDENGWREITTTYTPQGRMYSYQCLTSDGKAFMFGGYSYDGFVALNDTWLFDFDTEEWNQITTVGTPTARLGGVAILLPDNNIMIHGGIISGTTVNNMYYFDGTTYTSKTYTNTLKRGYHAATLMSDGNVLIFGGLNATLNYDQNTYVYNYLTETVTLLSLLDSPLERQLAVLATIGTKSYLIGGSYLSAFYSDNWVFENGSWSQEIVNNTYIEKYATSAAIYNGKITTFSGFNGSQLNDLEIFQLFEVNEYTTEAITDTTGVYYAKPYETIYDICLNKSGSLDNIDLFLNANDFSDWNDIIVAGQAITIPSGIVLQSNNATIFEANPCANVNDINDIDSQIDSLEFMLGTGTRKLFENGNYFLFEDGKFYIFEN